MAMINFHIVSKRFFLKCKELSDRRVVSITKREYGSTVDFLKRFIKSWKSISDEWLECLEFS